MALFEAHGDDPKILSDLKAELEHRKTPTMRGLLEEVEAALAVVSDRPTAPPASPDTKRQSSPASATKTQNSAHQTPSEAPPEDEYEGVQRGKLGSMRPCGGLKDVPNRWVWPPKRDLELSAAKDAPFAERYADALRQLISDMRRQKKGQRSIALEGGEAINLDLQDKGYRFPYDGDAELFEGARVILEVGGKQASGRIVSIAEKYLTVSTDEDFGHQIEVARLKVDNTAMIEALAERLEKVAKGESHLNLPLAEDVIANAGDPLPPQSVPAERKGVLNDLQIKSVGHMLSNAVTYLWGPPGTGKTQTLGLANELLFEADKRILICSNTNQAVDQVLLKMCEALGTAHPALVEGKVLRLGQIHHQETQAKFKDWISLDGIVARKSAELTLRKEQLEDETARIRKVTEKARTTLERFRALEQAEVDLSNQRLRADGLHRAYEAEMAKANALPNRIRALEDEYQGWRAAGRLKRLILRSEENILAELAEAKTAKARATQAIEQAQAAAEAAHHAIGPLELQVRRLHQDLSGADRNAAQKVVDDADEILHPLLNAIAQINRKLEEIEKTVVVEARIVGATVTKTYLSPQHFSNFDVVIVDEASMVMLPALFYVAGLAKEKVIVSGDFRQLSPIVPTDQQAILDLIGNDIFHAAGIADAFASGADMKRTAMLREQWRMNDAICRLISPRMYSGRLVTPEKRKSKSFPSAPPPFDAELTIIDTSAIGPFVSKDGSSRFNLLHVLAIRNLCRHLRDIGFVSDGSRLGICAPYAAQAKLMKRVLLESGLGELVEAGTVHRYQGDEKVAMVIDIPDSLGERNVGMFSQAEDPDDVGAKLFNVAVSRTQAALIFVANLAYLDAKLPSNAFLRELLHAVQAKGKVIDARDVIGLWPIADDLRSFGRPFDLDGEALRSGLFRQTDFDAVFMADVERARKGVAIFSGFVTPQRVAVYDGLFRGKLASGVPIRCVTRPPQRNGSIPEDLGRQALDGLEAMGCRVDTRWDIHQKMVIIDDEIVWFGSLNPLSHTSRTDETMLRFTGRSTALQLAAFLAVDAHVNPDKAEGLAFVKENPACGGCGGRTFYQVGRYGPYWGCEKGCGWTQNVGRPAKEAKPAGRDHKPSKKGPPCPECGAPTALRDGKYGEFWGCTAYPKCHGIAKAKGKAAMK